MGKMNKTSKEDFDQFSRDVEKATEPLMDRARKVKEQVDSATAEFKGQIESQEAQLKELTVDLKDKSDEIHGKTERVMAAGDKFLSEAETILREDPSATAANRPFAFRGVRLYLFLAIIVILAVLVAVFLLYKRQ